MSTKRRAELEAQLPRKARPDDHEVAERIERLLTLIATSGMGEEVPTGRALLELGAAILRANDLTPAEVRALLEAQLADVPVPT